MGLFLVVHRQVYYPGLLSAPFWDLKVDPLPVGGGDFDGAVFTMLRCVRGWVSTPLTCTRPSVL